MRNVPGLRAILILTGSALASGCPITLECPEGTTSGAMNHCIPDDAGLNDGGSEGDAMVVLDGGVPVLDGGVPVLDGGVPVLDGGGMPLPDAPIDACAAQAFYADSDGDGFGDGAEVMMACTAPAGYVEDDTDCDDGAELIHPMATERCDMARLDENCDGTANEGCECYIGETRSCPGESEIGECIAGTQSCDTSGHWMSLCMGTIRPATESCDNRDNDCDAMIDDGPEADAACGTVVHGTPDCVLGACRNVCNAGYADCSASAGCETALGTVTNCTGCGAACGWGCRGTTGSWSCNDPTSMSLSVEALFPQTTCTVRGDGSLACWGDNRDGEVGNGTTTGVTRATRVGGLPSGGFVIDSAAGASHSCALVGTGPREWFGLVYCWGDNSVGQLGTGTADSLTPVLVAGLTSVVEIVAGFNFTCARRTDGSVVCWGENGHHELGQSTTTDSTTPLVVMGVTGAVALDATLYGVCAAVGSAGVTCWGAGHSGRETVALPGGLATTRVATGANHTCALTSLGRVYCWGANESGQIGNGSTTAVATPVAVGDFGSSALLPSAVDIAAGNASTCASTSAGRVWCWGANNYGQLGNGDVMLSNRTVPTVIPTLTGVIDVEVGDTYGCARTRGTTDATDAARMWCWGHNSAGELGDGTTTNTSVPVSVTAPS